MVIILEVVVADAFFTSIFSEEVKTLKTEVEKLSKDVNTYKTSSTEYHIKLETLQQYFKQQESELHRYYLY